MRTFEALLSVKWREKDEPLGYFPHQSFLRGKGGFVDEGTSAAFHAFFEEKDARWIARMPECPLDREYSLSMGYSESEYSELHHLNGRKIEIYLSSDPQKCGCEEKILDFIPGAGIVWEK